jgi:hypothetical protein
MAIGDRFKLKKAQLVPLATNIFEELTIPDGQTIVIDSFFATASESALANCQLIWDSQGTPEILWVISNEQPMPDKIWFQKTGDGIKKLAVCLANGCQNGYEMACEAEYEVINE